MQTMEHYQPNRIASEDQRETISVVVAVYNIAPWVEKCVRSILCQTYRNLQILLVDDGSTDDSGAICDRLAEEDDRIQVLHKANGGLSSARNYGRSYAVGRYLAYVDGDDWIDPEMYEDMLSAMQDTGSPLAACRYKQISGSQVLDESTERAVIFEGQEALESFLLEQDEIAIQNAAWNKLYEKSLCEELSFPEGKYYEDIVYTTKLLAKAPRTVYLDRAYYNYVVVREGSIMGKGIGERIFSDQIPNYEEKEAFLKSIGRSDLADVHRYFLYKRLLLYVLSLAAEEKTASPERKAQCREFRSRIRARLLAEKNDMERVYACKGANPNEYKKMKIYLAGEKKYLAFMAVNTRLIVPLKQKLRGLRG